MKLKFQIRKQSKINKNFRMGGLDYYPSKFRWQQEKDERREKKAEYHRQYNEANKEKRNEHSRQYYENNKEEILEQKRQYKENNKEKILENQRQYNKTPAGIKSSRIFHWKKRGVKLPDDYPDWDIFYEEEYIKATHCEECLVELTEDKRNTSTTKMLDHSHETGEFRNILCSSCNTKRR